MSKLPVFSPVVWLAGLVAARIVAAIPAYSHLTRRASFFVGNMDPKLINAQDRSRARPVPLHTSVAFRRMIRSVLPHRKLVFSGIAASIVYALLHSVSIFAALPVLRVMLDDEGLHGWSDRQLAEKRLGVQLAFPGEKSGEDDAILIVRQIEPTSPLAGSAIRVGDLIVSLNGEQPGAKAWLKRVAFAEVGEEIRFKTRSAEGTTAQPYSVIAAEYPLKLRVARDVLSFIPRDPSGSNRLTVLKYVLVWLVLVVMSANACRFAGEYWVRLGVLRGVMDLRRQLYKKVLRLPMSRFSRDTGDMVTRFVQDIQEIQRGLMSLFGKTIREPFKAGFILLWALALDWRLTLAMFVIAPGAVLVFWKTGSSVKKANKKLLRGYGAMISALSGTLASINIVKAYTGEAAERRRLWQVDRSMFRQQKKIIRLEAMLSPLIEVVAIVLVAGGAVWLGKRVIGGEIDLSVFGTLVVALGMLFDPLRKLADVYTRVMRSGAGAERLFELLDAPEETEPDKTGQKLESFTDSIEFRGVTFTYPESDHPALCEIDLKVCCGETIALVGRNGSGKSTLMGLLTRFYDPSDGQILLDGVDLRSYALRSLRRNIGLVTQDAVVFPIPLADNIAYGTRNVSRERVMDAARRAFADEFIRQTPQGYDTVPGEMGRTLSGGQRQRISIARAILRDPPILIFDEATSQVDSESEQRIQAALKDFAQERTTFIVAHRLSTIRFADRIVVLDEGRIIDNGTHEELSERCSFYRGLCETQLQA